MILAIDPGRDKSGIAILDQKKEVLYRKIIPSQEVMSYLDKLLNKFTVERFVIGNGTSSREMKRKLERLKLPIIEIDEAYTTIEAEKRYRQEHLQTWQKLFSFLKWKPSEPVDDYVAIILAERYIDSIRE